MLLFDDDRILVNLINESNKIFLMIVSGLIVPREVTQDCMEFVTIYKYMNQPSVDESFMTTHAVLLRLSSSS